MQPIKIAILVALALFVTAPGATSAKSQETAGSNALPPECAARDQQLLAQLEQYGEWREMRGAFANEAFWIIMRARRACYDARFSEALALYDSIPIRNLAGSSTYGAAAPSPPN